MLAACAMKDAPSEPDIITAEQLLSRRLDNQDLQKFLASVDAMPKAQTWDFKSLYWAAIYFNPDLRLARAQIAMPKAAAITAAQIPNPALTLPLTHDTTTSPHEWLFGVGLTQRIETNGKRDIRQKVAEQQIASSQFLAINKAWDVRANVLNAMLALSEARETIALSEHYANTEKNIVSKYDERLSQGQMPTVIASQARVSYQQAVLQVQQARSAEGDAKVQLAAAIGVPREALNAITIRTDTMHLGKPSVMDDIAKAEILEHHPALLAALADYQVAQNNLQLELANRVPDIEIGPGYQWDSHQGGIFALNLTLNLPIFNNNDGPIAEANAKRLVAARQLEAMQSSLLNTIEQAETADQNARREWKVTTDVVNLQATKLKHLHELLHGTESSVLPTLYGNAELQNAQIAQHMAESKWRKARATRETATRTPLFGPVVNATFIAQPQEQ